VPFQLTELVFLGFKVSAAGLSPDDKKVESIQNACTPQNSDEVGSFLGLVNYCSRFIPDFSTLSDPCPPGQSPMVLEKAPPRSF